MRLEKIGEMKKGKTAFIINYVEVIEVTMNSNYNVAKIIAHEAVFLITENCLHFSRSNLEKYGDWKKAMSRNV